MIGKEMANLQNKELAFEVVALHSNDPYSLVLKYITRKESLRNRSEIIMSSLITNSFSALLP